MSKYYVDPLRPPNLSGLGQIVLIHIHFDCRDNAGNLAENCKPIAPSDQTGLVTDSTLNTILLQAVVCIAEKIRRVSQRRPKRPGGEHQNLSGIHRVGTLTRSAAVVIIALILGATAFAASQTSTASQKLGRLLTNLHAAKWTERAEAYVQLRDDPTATRKAEVKSALLDLLDRENRTDWSKEPGFDSRASESHAEYLGELGDTVDSLADWSDPLQLCILAHSAMNPDSKLAARLAMTGQLILPCLMEMTKSTSMDDRYQAVSILVQLRAKIDTLSPQTNRIIREVTIAALHDPEKMVRLGTIAAVRDFGGEELIPALQEVAEKDPAPEVQGHSIRKYAASAVVVMKRRIDSGSAGSRRPTQ